MSKKWFQYKEVMAGAKRLELTYKIYKMFGEFPLRLIAFFVTLISFLTSKEKRQFSYQYFDNLENYTSKKYPKISSSFRQFLNYGNSLADKIISFSGNLSAEKFEFIDKEAEKINELSKNKKPIIFLTTHIGNAEILRSLLISGKYPKPKNINVFLEKRACEIFEEFIKKIEVDVNIEAYAIEDIGPDTAIELSSKLEEGEQIFIAGDRIAYNNTKKVYKTKFLNKNISLPLGALKLAQVLESNIFFIVCAKENKKFKIHAQSFVAQSSSKKEIFEQLKKEYVEFLEKYTIKYPYQFFHFYKIFED